MKVLWFSWKDRSHPLAGGAETVSGEVMDRLVRDGHEVKLITSTYANSRPHENQNGIDIFRTGNKYSVYLKAKKLYKKRFVSWADIVIDEMNTIPFGCGLYIKKSKNFLLCYQLARKVWFYQMFFPMSLIGYLIEPILLWGITNKYHAVITESNSTKSEMQTYGFKNIHTLRVGIPLSPLKSLEPKGKDSVVLSIGSIRPMKRTLHAIKAFEIARDKDSSLKMIVAGDNHGKYAEKVSKYVSNSRHSKNIKILGRISTKQKMNLMKSSKLVLVTSVKEGWGLIVTEANSQGTPAIVYDVDGLRDSVKDKLTGILVPNTDYHKMGNEIISILSDNKRYESLRKKAWKWSHEFNFENSYNDFLKIISNCK